MKRLLAVPLALIAFASVPAQDWFRTTRVYGSDLGPFEALADFDGDGDLDAVSLQPNFSAPGAVLRLSANDGQGGFSAGPAYFLMGTTSTPIVGDLDGDGRAEIVLGNVPGGVAIFGTLVALQVSATGLSLWASVGLPAVASPVALADADADGDLDVLVAGIGTAEWWMNGGSGFTAGPVVTHSSFIVDAAAVDWNQDGRADVVIVDQTGAIRVFLTTAAGFASGGSVPHALGTTALESIGTADLDGDGLRDVFVIDRLPGAPLKLQAFVAMPGGGVVAAAPNQFASVSPGVCHPGDWDGDGTLDILVTNGALTLLRGIGGGQFALAFQMGLARPVSPALAHARGRGIGDIDADGDADYVFQYEVLRGDGTAAGPHRLAGNLGPSAVDADGDGDVDFLSLVSNGSAWAENDGRGVFTQRTITLTSPFVVPLIVGGGESFADYDGDGALEAIGNQSLFFPVQPSPAVIFTEHRIFEEQSSGRWADRGPAAAPGVQGVSGVPFDFENDGDLDLASAAGVWRNSGAGLFVGPLPVFASWTPLVAADLDRDGDTDLVARATTSSPFVSTAMAVIRNGGASMTLEPLNAGSVYAGASVPSPLVADLDGNGFPEIVWANAPGQPATVAINVGGSFPFQVPLPGVEGSVVAGDFDGDGWKDLISAGAGTPPATILVHRFRGPGLPFEAPLVFNASFPLVDVDGDGDLDSIVPVPGSGSQAIVEGLARRQPGAGFFRQFGTGNTGSGGFVPLLGAAGPARTGQTVVFRMRDGLGGAQAILAIGLAESNLTNVPLPGLTSYNSPWALLLPLVLGGAPGAPGTGRVDVLAPMPPAFANTSFFLQFALADPAPASGIAVSQGLEMHVGN